MQDFTQMAQQRQSCRAFTDQRPTMDQLRTMVQTACLAPSACNSQPWHFVAVNDPALAADVGAATRLYGLNAFTAGCSAFIVVCQRPPKLLARVASVVSENAFVSIDVGIAAAHLCYAARQQGLDTCIMGCFDEARLRTLLHLPDSYKVRLVLAVGTAADPTLRPKKRRPLEENLTCYGE